MAAEFPGKVTHFKRSIAYGDLIVLHCHQEWPGDQGYAGINIFRFDENVEITVVLWTGRRMVIRLIFGAG